MPEPRWIRPAFAAALTVVLYSTAALADARLASLQGLPVQNLRVTGIEKELGDSIRDGLALAVSSSWLRGEKATFMVDRLEQDVERARLFLARNGYPDATVEASVLTVQSGQAVRIELVVQPGAPVRVTTVDLLGMPSDVVPPELSLAPGQIVQDDRIQTAATEIQDSLRNQGYAYATAEAKLQSARTEAHVELIVEPGARYTVGSIEVEGAPADLHNLVLATLRIRPGTIYSPRKLRDAEDNLRELDLFRRIRVGVRPESENQLAVHCEVSPRLARSFTSGIGYFSDEQLRLDAEWRHRNLLGGGRGILVGGRASRFLQRLQLDLVWPRVGGTPLRAIAGTAIRREDEAAYELLDVRLDLNLGARVRRTVWASGGVRVGYIDVLVHTKDPTLDDPVGMITAVPISVTRDTSDNPVYPARGLVLRAEVEVTPPGLGSVTQYVRSEARASAYRAVGPTVLATRVGAGLAHPMGDTETVLASRRMYSGGSRSMRGYGRRGLGPQDEDGEPLGGNWKVEASMEWRFPVWGRLEGAAFVDAGQVWTRRGAWPGHLEWATGPALMVRTPVGPIRVDWGILLSSRDDESRHVVHVSVGHPF